MFVRKPKWKPFDVYPDVDKERMIAIFQSGTQAVKFGKCFYIGGGYNGWGVDTGTELVENNMFSNWCYCSEFEKVLP